MVPPRDMLAVCGDFNAKLSSNSHFSNHIETNNNGGAFVTNTNLLLQTGVSRDIIAGYGLMRTLKSRGIKSTIFSGGKSGLIV